MVAAEAWTAPSTSPAPQSVQRAWVQGHRKGAFLPSPLNETRLPTTRLAPSLAAFCPFPLPAVTGECGSGGAGVFLWTVARERYRVRGPAGQRPLGRAAEGEAAALGVTVWLSGGDIPSCSVRPHWRERRRAGSLGRGPWGGAEGARGAVGVPPVRPPAQSSVQAGEGRGSFIGPRRVLVAVIIPPHPPPSESWYRPVLSASKPVRLSRSVL